MSSSLAEYILSMKDASGGAATAQLQLIGKEAARKHVVDGVPLNDTLRTMSKEAGLNFEQIQRVAEYANNDVFVRRFAQPYERNIAFPLADAREVAGTLHSALLPVEKTAARQSLTKTASYKPGQELVSFSDLFGGARPSKEKVASFDSNEVARKILALRETVRDTRNEVAFIEAEFLTKVAQLNRIVHQEMSSGTHPWEVGAAVVKARPCKELFGVIASELGRSMETAPLTKMAALGYEVEEDNPVTSLVQDLENITQKLQSSEELTQRTLAAIQDLLGLLRGPEEVNPIEQLFAEDKQLQPQDQQAAAQMGQELAQMGGAPAQPAPGQPV